MTPNHPPIEPLHFCYWLRGYTEVTEAKLPSKHQWQIINDHLNAVFTKVTPTYPAVSGSLLIHNDSTARGFVMC